MLESNTREVAIQDVRRSVFLTFLEYLYTGKVASFEDECMELYAVANRVRLFGPSQDGYIGGCL